MTSINSAKEHFNASMEDKNLKHNDPTCEENEDCPNRYYCNEDTEKCKRENIFPLKPMDYISIVCLSFFAALTTSAGIGGGEIIVPALKTLFLYIQSEASILSQCCIMMAGITRFILNYKKKHPYRNAVAIEYKAAMLLMPSIFFGLSLGVMLHKIVPSFVQEIALLFVLIFCFYESIKKGIQVWLQESKDFTKAQEQVHPKENENLIAKHYNTEGDYEERSDVYSRKESFNKLFIVNYIIKYNLLKFSFLFIVESSSSFKSLFRQSTVGKKYSDINVTPVDENSIVKEETDSSIANELEYAKGEIGDIQRKDNSHWQFDKLAPIWGIFIILIIQAVLKDGNLVGVKTCSTEFWLIYINVFSILYSYCVL